MNNGVTVDASQVLRMFSELNSRQQKNVYKNALRKAGRILQKETKTQLRSVVGKAINHKNRWNGKTLGNGVKMKVDKEATEAKVHIMGDFRLKFFELGTTTRQLRKNGANRGPELPLSSMHTRSVSAASCIRSRKHR